MEVRIKVNKIYRYGSKFLYKIGERSFKILFDGEDVLSNYSKASLQLPYLNENNVVSIKWPLNDNADILINNMPEYIQLVILRSMHFMLEHNTKINIALIGNNGYDLLMRISAIIPYCDKDNKIYSYSSQYINYQHDNTTQIIGKIESIHQEYHFYNMCILNLLDIDLASINNILVKVVLSTKLTVRLLIIANNDKIIKENYDLLKNGEMYYLNDNVFVAEMMITNILWKSIYEKTNEFYIEKEKRIIISAIKEIKSSLDAYAAEEYDMLINRIINIENKIIEIDHEFYDKNLKWYINLLKESMIEYRLGFGTLNTIKDNYNQILNAIV